MRNLDLFIGSIARTKINFEFEIFLSKSLSLPIIKSRFKLNELYHS